ncbi:MAG: pseudouridine synthase [Eubacteriales bacterium]|nr:pseudouridine synthase [Eubacteriales bacterium]
MEQRLQKILSGAGICSRRAAERLLEEGRVTVNGRTAQLGEKADPECDEIIVDGRRIGGHERTMTIMLNKPAGVVTTMHDERGRRSVADLVQQCPVRVLPVGRLDQYSEGLLLLSNDGELIHQLTHPRHEITKWYEVTVRGDERGIPRLAQPMVIEGYRIRPAEVKTRNRLDNGDWVLSIGIHEGRNRQIRRMCAQCGLRVIRLKRVAEGGLTLDPGLAPGKWRELTGEELRLLAGDE